MNQMYFYFIHCDIVAPVHVAALKTPSYLIVNLFTEQTSTVATFIAAEWREQEAFFFLPSALDQIEINAVEQTYLKKSLSCPEHLVLIIDWKLFLQDTAMQHLHYRVDGKRLMRPRLF